MRKSRLSLFKSTSMLISVIGIIMIAVTIIAAAYVGYSMVSSSITDDIFNVNNSESCYKSVLLKMSEKLSYDEILNLFNNNLSLNARIYLKSCCNMEK